MQIACKRFGCQKAVEVCYWTCKHRKNCKDWKGAIEGQPGLSAITERLQMAAAKSGRPFDANTLVKPVRFKRARTVPALRVPLVKAEAKVAPKAVAPKMTSKPVTNGTHHKQRPVKLRPPERKIMPKPDEEKIEATTETTTPKSSSKLAPKPAKPKPPTNGTVYLLLSKNGKYKELRESDLMKEAATILKDSSLRLVKGQYLVPQITFKPFDE